MNISIDTIDANAVRIITCLHGAGYQAYVIGGAVRDLIMGNLPKDFDIATDASPDVIKGLFNKTVPVGVGFGVTLVLISGKPYEVAQFRTDGQYEDGRRPISVYPASVREDVLRRDLTINALILDVTTGAVIDHVSGIDDIERGIVRTIGSPEIRFNEDRLRMIRAVRFAARFNFKVDPETMSAIQALAPSITNVSAERIGQEIASIISGPYPERGLDLLDESGLLEVILPEVAAMKDIDQPPEFHPEGDVFVHTRDMLRRFGGGSLTLGFSILFHDIGKPVTRSETDRIRFNCHDAVGADMAETVLRRLKMPKETIDRVRYLVAKHMAFMNVTHMRESTLRRFMAEQGFNELLELHYLDCLASHGDLSTYDMLVKRMQSPDNEASQTTLPKPLLSGNDLISLGYLPGPEIGILLKWIYDEQLEGRVNTYNEAIAAIRYSYSPEDDQE